MVVQRAEQFGRGEEGKGRRQCRQVGPGHRWERERVLSGFAGLRERVGRAGERKVGRGAGPAKLGWVGLVFPVPLIFLFSISYFKHHTNYLNSNSNLNSTLALKQKEKYTSMNATTNFKFRQILVTCEGKLI